MRATLASPRPSELELLSSFGDFLADVERFSAAGAGSVSLLDEGAGGVFGTVMAEQGRVCWANAEASPLRLGTLIARETGLEPGELRLLYDECRRLRRRFGECLVERGLLAADTLRALLLEQVAAALGVLVRAEAAGRCAWSTWRTLRSESYQPAFTFTAAEILSSALHHDVELRLAVPGPPLAFVDVVDGAEGDVVCLYRLDPAGDRVLPVLVSPGVGLGMRGARELYAGARPLLDVVAVEEAGEPYVAFLRRGEEGGLAVARAGDHVLVAELRGQAGFSALAAGLHRWRLEQAEGGR